MQHCEAVAGTGTGCYWAQGRGPWGKGRESGGGRGGYSEQGAEMCVGDDRVDWEADNSKERIQFL